MLIGCFVGCISGGQYDQREKDETAMENKISTNVLLKKLSVVIYDILKFLRVFYFKKWFYDTVPTRVLTHEGDGKRLTQTIAITVLLRQRKSFIFHSLPYLSCLTCIIFFKGNQIKYFLYLIHFNDQHNSTPTVLF
jgi:hypothetical protein